MQFGGVANCLIRSPPPNCSMATKGAASRRKRRHQMAAMMQASYWDAPIKENELGRWWNHVAQKVPELAASGLSALWLPPISKCVSPTSNGYDPYDYLDLGDFDQKGSVKTAHGDRAELEDLIDTLPTGAPRPGQWHRRADHCASSSCRRRVLCPSRGLRPLHHAARRHRVADWPCLCIE